MKLNARRGTFTVLLTAVLMCTLVPLGQSAEGEDLVVLEKQRDEPPPEIDFLTAPPRIDGELDPSLRQLPKRDFNYAIRSGPELAIRKPSYRVAYGTSFFYLFITLEAEHLKVRDRAYQNGDGVVLVLAPGTASREGAEEFYILGFAPAGDGYGPWKFTWSYNGTWPFLPMGEDAVFEARHMDGQLSFELLLPWHYVYPHHPWWTDPLEFNLTLTKALGDTDEVVYAVTADEEKKSIGFSPRIGLRFARPELKQGVQHYAVLERNHVVEGEPLRLRTVALSAAPGTDRLFVGLFTGEKEFVNYQRFGLALTPGLTRGSFEVPTEDHPPGAYQILWRSSLYGSMGEIDWSILPRLNVDAVEEVIATSPGTVPASSRTTLLFEFERMRAEAARLMPYDTAGSLRLEMARFERRLAAVRNGVDPYAGATGYVRRAFRSEIDGTLQPYTVRIPEDYDAGRRYPAIVFLHGSDVDDRAARRHDYLEQNGFFVIAPKGRDPRGAYILDHAQQDIEEAIADALSLYSIDPDRLLLAGFSMGGYGAYRTFYEHPERYRGLAVFSGDPDLANRYLPAKGHPNFLQEEYLTPFRGARVAVFHGRGDRNCPFELTDEVVRKLESIGARVDYYIDEEVGHSPPRDPEILEAFRGWLLDAAGPPTQ